MHTLGPDIDPL